MTIYCFECKTTVTSDDGCCPVCGFDPLLDNEQNDYFDDEWDATED